MLKNHIEWLRSLPTVLATRLILYSYAKFFLRVPGVHSFSQCGEDILIKWATMGQAGITEPGTYVDVGCNLPITDSNTFELYLRGWRGINVDANSAMIEECKRVRKKDVSVCAAVSDSEREVTFHRSRIHLVSTIDEPTLEKWKKIWDYSEEDRETVTTRTLTSILDEHWKYGNGIDLLSIDVEGQDLQVLKGLDFQKYRPKVIIIETYEFDNLRETELYSFLSAKGYRLKHFAYLNACFIDEALLADGQ